MQRIGSAMHRRRANALWYTDRHCGRARGRRDNDTTSAASAHSACRRLPRSARRVEPVLSPYRVQCAYQDQLPIRGRCGERKRTCQVHPVGRRHLRREHPSGDLHFGQTRPVELGVNRHIGTIAFSVGQRSKTVRESLWIQERHLCRLTCEACRCLLGDGRLFPILTE